MSRMRLFRSYYRINRDVWPDMVRRQAALSAIRLVRWVRR